MLDAYLIVYGTTVNLASPSWLTRLWIEKRWSWRREPERIVDYEEGITRSVDSETLQSSRSEEMR